MNGKTSVYSPEVVDILGMDDMQRASRSKQKDTIIIPVQIQLRRGSPVAIAIDNISQIPHRSSAVLTAPIPLHYRYDH